MGDHETTHSTALRTNRPNHYHDTLPYISLPACHLLSLAVKPPMSNHQAPIPAPPSAGGWLKVAKDIVAGTAGGISVTLVGHPFDTLKVRLQTQSQAKPLYSEWALRQSAPADESPLCCRASQPACLPASMHGTVC